MTVTNFKKYLLAILAAALILIFLGVLLPACVSAPGNNNVFTFSDTSVTAASEGTGYEIDGTDLTINAAGTYTLTGSCTEGSVTVKKEVTGVTLVLDDLTLTSSETAPISCNKSSSVTIEAQGESTLTNTEDASTEDTSDSFEGAVIKVKSNASLNLTGSGTLNIEGTCKNGIKGGTGASVTVSDLTLNVNATDNALTSDGSVVVNSGVLTLNAGNDGLKSGGTLTVNGGSFTLDCADDAFHAANVTLVSGTYTLSSGDDGVHADEALVVGVQNAENGPDITITASYEGLEGATVTLYSGSGSMAASDDGINAANGDLDSSYGFTLDIWGGNWYVNAHGHALDSNGDINFHGGVTEFYGASNNGDAALDYDGSCTYDGGTFLAVGTTGMAQTPSTGTYVAFGTTGMGGMTNETVDASTSEFVITEGSAIVIKDSDGNVLYSATGVKAANSIVFGAEPLVEGETYTLYIDGAEAATATAETDTGATQGFGGSMGGQRPGGTTGTQSGTTGSSESTAA